MRLSEVCAVISGGASGLGLATARHLLAHGAQVTLLDLDAEKGTAMAAELGAGAHFQRADVTDEAGIAHAVAAAQTAMGGLNAAISCAGILGAGRALGRDGAMPLNRFESTVRVNLVGTFNLVKAAVERIQHNTPGEDGERGVVINTASIAGYEGQIGQAAYSASKAGVIGMTLPLAREFARLGVRVVTLAPGVFHTPMVDGMPQDVYDSLCAQVPYPSRLGKPEEFADAVAFALTSRYLNGETLRIDGAIRLQPK